MSHVSLPTLSHGSAGAPCVRSPLHVPWITLLLACCHKACWRSERLNNSHKHPSQPMPHCNCIQLCLLSKYYSFRATLRRTNCISSIAADFWHCRWQEAAHHKVNHSRMKRQSRLGFFDCLLKGATLLLLPTAAGAVPKAIGVIVRDWPPSLDCQSTCRLTHCTCGAGRILSTIMPPHVLPTAGQGRPTRASASWPCPKAGSCSL